MYGRRRRALRDSYRERRLDEHICLQGSRVGISQDNIGKRGVCDHFGRFVVKPFMHPEETISRP
jgi:hypothetical protein